MSKSIGNVFRIKDALKLYHPNVLRYFFFATLYTSPLECNTEAILLAEKNIDKWAVSMRRFLEVEPTDAENIDAEECLLEKFGTFQEKFQASLRDNFNTPEAFSVIHGAGKELNKFIDTYVSFSSKTKEKLQEIFNDFFDTLGFYHIEETKIVVEDGKVCIDLKKLATKLEIEVEESISIEGLMEKLIGKRNFARKSKDFATADLIRDELNSFGVVLEDGSGDTTYRLEK
jgi:cysteinyl-tRNA synthetase